ncbi:hypothetical protein ACFWGP_07440 [Agromyces sp. NPDC127015]|uniref:hypothetical protein n=1 Tax=Agromyces sp. NPDC127015 TaxID=3347108 RepID=UPI003659A7F9
MARGEEQWLARSVADRKVLLTAMEEGFVAELLYEFFVITEAGRQQAFPALDLLTARAALRRMIELGLVGTYLLNSDNEYLGIAAVASVERDAVWTTPGSEGLCLYLTATGEDAVGIREVPTNADSSDQPS